MCKYPGKYMFWFRSLFFLALLLSCNIAYPQYHTENDSIKKIPPDVINKITNTITLFSKGVLLSIPATIIPTHIVIRDRNLVFFASLKSRASKNQLKKRSEKLLYKDLI